MTKRWVENRLLNSYLRDPSALLGSLILVVFILAVLYSVGLSVIGLPFGEVFECQHRVCHRGSLNEIVLKERSWVRQVIVTI